MCIRTVIVVDEQFQCCTYYKALYDMHALKSEPSFPGLLSCKAFGLEKPLVRVDFDPRGPNTPGLPYLDCLDAAH